MCSSIYLDDYYCTPNERRPCSCYFCFFSCAYLLLFRCPRVFIFLWKILCLPYQSAPYAYSEHKSTMRPVKAEKILNYKTFWFFFQTNFSILKGDRQQQNLRVFCWILDTFHLSPQVFLKAFIMVFRLALMDILKLFENLLKAYSKVPVVP